MCENFNGLGNFGRNDNMTVKVSEGNLANENGEGKDITTQIEKGFILKSLKLCRTLAKLAICWVVPDNLLFYQMKENGEEDFGCSLYWWIGVTFITFFLWQGYLSLVHLIPVLPSRWSWGIHVCMPTTMVARCQWGSVSLLQSSDKWPVPTDMIQELVNSSIRLFSA